MNPQKAFKLFQARQTFDRQVEWLRAELRTCTRVDYLQPALDLIEYVVRDMAELAGVTAEVKAHAKEYAALRSQVANRALELYAASKPAKPAKQKKPAPPKLRLINGGKR